MFERIAGIIALLSVLYFFISGISILIKCFIQRRAARRILNMDRLKERYALTPSEVETVCSIIYSGLKKGKQKDEAVLDALNNIKKL